MRPVGVVYKAGNQILQNKNGTPRRFETFGRITRSIQPFLEWDDPQQRKCWKELMSLAKNHTSEK